MGCFGYAWPARHPFALLRALAFTQGFFPELLSQANAPGAPACLPKRPAAMVAAAASPIDRSSALDSMLKSKNIGTIDDLDAPEEEPLLELQTNHNLIVIVEMCQATRPSKLGSLKGSHEKYVDELGRLTSTVESLKGAGAVEVIEWKPGDPIVPSSSSFSPPQPPAGGGATPGRRSRPQSAGAMSSRPQSAHAMMRTYLGGPPEERQGPRIGSFEVSYKLVNTLSGKQYGPVEVFSKISSGCWPGASELMVKRIQEQLQGFLQVDMGNAMIYQHVRMRPTRERARAPPPPRMLARAANALHARAPRARRKCHVQRPMSAPTPTPAHMPVSRNFSRRRNRWRRTRSRSGVPERCSSTPRICPTRRRRRRRSSGDTVAACSRLSGRAAECERAVCDR